MSPALKKHAPAPLHAPSPIVPVFSKQAWEPTQPPFRMVPRLCAHATISPRAAAMQAPSPTKPELSLQASNPWQAFFDTRPEFTSQAKWPAHAPWPTKPEFLKQLKSPWQPFLDTPPEFSLQAVSPRQAPAPTKPVLSKQASGPTQFGAPASRPDGKRRKMPRHCRTTTMMRAPDRPVMAGLLLARPERAESAWGSTLAPIGDRRQMTGVAGSVHAPFAISPCACGPAKTVSPGPRPSWTPRGAPGPCASCGSWCTCWRTRFSAGRATPCWRSARPCALPTSTPLDARPGSLLESYAQARVHMAEVGAW